MFRDDNRDAVACADEHCGPTGIVDVYVYDVRPKAVLDQTPECSKERPDVQEIRRVREA